MRIVATDSFNALTAYFSFWPAILLTKGGLGGGGEGRLGRHFPNTNFKSLHIF